jgi:hypothetical protein
MPVMLSKPVRVRIIAAIATLAALLCGSWQPRSRFATAVSSGGSLARALGASAAFGLGQLPKGLTLATAEAEAGAVRKFFALVTTDLDADGDLDVIASNGALDLLVWLNDGSGHLTAHRAASSAWQASPSGRAIEGPGDELSASAQDDDDDVPVARVDLRVVWRDSTEALLPRARIERRGSAFVPTHSSRGPPRFPLQQQA